MISSHFLKGLVVRQRCSPCCQSTHWPAYYRTSCFAWRIHRVPPTYGRDPSITFKVAPTTWHTRPLRGCRATAPLICGIREHAQFPAEGLGRGTNLACGSSAKLPQLRRSALPQGSDGPGIPRALANGCLGSLGTPALKLARSHKGRGHISPSGLDIRKAAIQSSVRVLSLKGPALPPFEALDSHTETLQPEATLH